jgi:hypothetical protein
MVNFILVFIFFSRPNLGKKKLGPGQPLAWGRLKSHKGLWLLGFSGHGGAPGAGN